MASSSSSPSLPILSSQSWNYDVFLSFRGEDTRKTFVDHLYSALDQSGIHTYKDDVTLPRGESISPALLKAIEASQIAVIIFSKNYANSTWCLDELSHIMECRDNRNQIVMPIFYGVEPTEVRKQKGTYKEAFDKHELENKKKIQSWGEAVVSDPCGWLCAPLQEYRKYRETATKQELENKEKIESWRNALVEASNISGWETKHIANGHEAQGIKQIVDEISQRLVTSRENEKLIGMRTRVKGLKSDLQIESGGVCMVGIWGVGGIGKTTLASSIYDEISSMYGGCCFVKNIRERAKKNGLEDLQEKMLSGIFKKNHVAMARLRHTKVLIVLDDVDQLDQLEALVGSHDWFGEGSRIIITTRDEHLLIAHGVDVTHQMSLLNHDEAVMLFRKHAHRDRTPTEDFEKLSKEVVFYAGGLPLALKVLGSFLCGRNIMQWRSALDRLKGIPHKDIIGILRISFDGLEQDEKDLFLDIACFFRRKDTRQAMKLFEACRFYPIIGVEVLRQKALITISNGTFDMHDLVQEMGHYIVRGEHPRNPEKHSRVWKKEDVSTVLDMAATTELDNIEAIDLGHHVEYEESQRFLQVAGNMNKLRWIDLYSYEQNYYQSDEIIVPFPEKFPPAQLRCLIIKGGILQRQLWKGYKYLPNLTYMELRDLVKLIKIPDFAGLPNLETFKLGVCVCLEEIHPSIGRLERLVFIYIRHCRRLRLFPPITRIKKLETLIFSECNKLEIFSEIKHDMEMNHRRLQFSHRTLRKLDLRYCCLGDEEIGSDVWDLPNLEELDLSWNPLISQLDFRILRLPRLKLLNVIDCEGLVELSELPSSISVVTADGCCSLESFGDISNCKWLWKLSLYGKNRLDQLHGDTLINSMIQGNSSKDHFMSVALQHQFPNRFVEYTVRQHLPDKWYNNFCGFLICIVSNTIYPRINIIIGQEDPPFELSQEYDEAVEPIYDGHTTFIGYVSFSSLRHTTLLSSSYNIISVSIKDLDETEVDSFYGGIKLIPRKSKSDEVQTTDCSGFWDKNSEDEDYVNTFTIHQCDSESSIEISWNPVSQIYIPID